MTRDRFDALCAALPGAHRVVQWGGSHVWKVGPRMFAIGRADAGRSPVSVTVKATPVAAAMLREQGLAGRAPHLPRGGWVRFTAEAPAALVADGIATSHGLILASLPRAARAAIAASG